MTNGSVEPPVLVLGIGNPLLGDDGAGLVLLAELADAPDPLAEYVDGGTQGLGLLGYLQNRRALVILDAVTTGAPPGTVHVLRGEEALRLANRRSSTAHESNAGELLATAALLGHLPQEVIVVGIEPGSLETGIGLSDAASHALGEAVAQAREVVSSASLCRTPGCAARNGGPHPQRTAETEVRRSHCSPL